MGKFHGVVVGLLLLCALLLVTSQHRARKAFIDLGRAQAAARKLDVEWNQLQLEQTRLAKHSLIDAVARRDLHMQPVAPNRTLYEELPAAARSAGDTSGGHAGARLASARLVDLSLLIGAR
jgi:cell division protein FtsL